MVRSELVVANQGMVVRISPRVASAKVPPGTKALVWKPARDQVS